LSGSKGMQAPSVVRITQNDTLLGGIGFVSLYITTPN